MEEAHQLGAEIHAREPVLAWEEVDGTIVVKTAVAEYRAPRLVITAGPWAAALVPVFRTLARPERQVLLWAQPRRPEHFKVGVFPVFNMETPEGHFYGYPVYGNPGFKIGKYHRYFPDADGPTMGLKTCLFTNSPDGHFILDRHPTCRHVVLAAGFSGHGFKSAA